MRKQIAQLSFRRILDGLVVVLALASTSAAASSSFPSETKTHMQLTSTPGCTACHSSGAGGFGTVTQPMGKTLQANGLIASDIATLDAALDTIESADTDSDGDGVGDIAELRAGTDPNIAGGGDSAPALGYGFGCASVGAPQAGLYGLVAVALLRQRRRSARSFV